VRRTPKGAGARTPLPDVAWSGGQAPIESGKLWYCDASDAPSLKVFVEIEKNDDDRGETK